MNEPMNAPQSEPANTPQNEPTPMPQSEPTPPKQSESPSAEAEGTPGEPAKDGTESEPTPPAPNKPKSLLDDDDTEEGAAQPKEGDGAAPNAEDIKKFCEGIPALDLGDGVKWDDATLQAMAPSLMELTGGDPKKAQGVVKAYTEYVQAQAKAQAEAAEAFNNALIDECKNRFGADLKKVANFAKQGGKEVFGDRLWNEMKTIPAFANNPDIMEKLAEVGRRFATDGGKSVARDGDSTTDRGDVLHRMYGTVSV